MNATIKNASHPSVLYYDSDYPSPESVYPHNFDSLVESQGIAHDVARYVALAQRWGKRVVELCCGTGRVSIPLAQHGCDVTAVDINDGLLSQFRGKIEVAPQLRKDSISVVRQDVTKLDLPDKDFDMAVCAFNSLLCIPDFTLQQETLTRTALHLRPGGLLALDIRNPLAMNLWGDEYPEPFFTRRNVHNGNVYTRFSAVDAMGADQVQRVYGWYEENKPDGSKIRSQYELHWRPVFRYEAVLMLEKAGFSVQRIFGGDHEEPLAADSIKMFIEAIKN